MLISLGWNHLKVKEFTPKELGVENPSDPHIRIQLRQKYFHLFFIPFFSLTKFWAVKKGGKYYEIPLEYVDAIRKGNFNYKAPWYTYIGSIILLLLVVLFFVAISL